MEGCEGVGDGWVVTFNSNQKMRSEVKSESLKRAGDFFSLLLERKVSGRDERRSHYCPFSIKNRGFFKNVALLNSSF